MWRCMNLLWFFRSPSPSQAEWRRKFKINSRTFTSHFQSMNIREPKFHLSCLYFDLDHHFWEIVWVGTLHRIQSPKQKVSIEVICITKWHQPMTAECEGQYRQVNKGISHLVLLKSRIHTCTEPRKSLCTWLRYVSSWPCLAFLPGPAWL